MRKVLVFTLSIVALVAVVQYGFAGEKSDSDIKYQTTCPVMGGEINKEIYEDHNGQRVYLCCEGCRAQFKDDPEKYIEKLEGEGITVAKVEPVQTKCPVTGEPVDKSIFTEYEGKKVYFCCAGCRDEFVKDPEKYMERSEAGGCPKVGKCGPSGKRPCSMKCMEKMKKS